MKSVRIFVSADIHGYYRAWDYFSDKSAKKGSMTRIAQFLKNEKVERDSCIIIDAGDAVSGNFSHLFIEDDVHPAVVCMNYADYDVFVPGNHEFNYGKDFLMRMKSTFKGDTVLCNASLENGEGLVKRHVVLERSGKRIAVVGAVTPLVEGFQRDTDKLRGMRIESARKRIEEELEKINADAVVAVIHAGLERENGIEGTSARDMVNGAEKIDAICLAHVHAVINGKTVCGIPVTEPGFGGEALSEIELCFDGDELEVRTRVHLIGEEIEEDSELCEKLAPFHKRCLDYAREPIGIFEGKNSTYKPYGDRALLRFMHRVMLDNSCAEITAVHLDNEDADFKEGSVRRKDIAYFYPYVSGEISVYRIKASTLKKYMEWSAAYFTSDGSGRTVPDPKRAAYKYSSYDYFGGLKYSFDLTRPVGQRLTELSRENGEPILDDETLLIGMNRYRKNMLSSSCSGIADEDFERVETTKGKEGGAIQAMMVKYLKERGKFADDGRDRFKVRGNFKD